jgi:hypothetical protein
MTRNAAGPACWVVEGFWTKPKHAFTAMRAGESIPDEWREWTADERYSWPKTLRQALHAAELIRRSELRLRGNEPVPLRLRNTDTGEIGEIEWYGRSTLTARYHVPGTPDTAIMPYKARLRGMKA